MEDKAPKSMPGIPTPAIVLIAVIFYIPFVCLLLPFKPQMDSVMFISALFFYYIPMLVCDTLRQSDFRWVIVGAFLQSLILTLATSLVLRALLYSRWRQLTSRSST